MAAPEWEAKCKRCGKCCYRLVEVDGKYERHTELHCPYFDEESRLCRIYEKRFQINQRCVELIPLNIPIYKANGFLPSDCSYIEDK